jgi:beta-1,4-mannosyl-glycoprotein beta-1,4-N-acetylglucosaminyltransferase
MNNPLIIDSFPFFNEHALLKARLEYLGPVVDKFLIFESSIDFSGKSRDFYFTDEVLAGLPFSEKVVVCCWVPSWWDLKVYFPFSSKFKYKKGLWGIQHKQRNSILRLLRQESPESVLVFGDLDEFPDAEVLSDRDGLLARLGSDPVCSFSQSMYYYNVNTLMDKDWRGTLVCKIGTAVRRTPKILRRYRLDYPVIGRGWHFSYFMSPEEVRKKIQAIADVENLSRFSSITSEQISFAMANSRDVYGRGELLEVRCDDVSVPTGLLQLLNKYIPQ